jgi:hypothetical protein
VAAGIPYDATQAEMKGGHVAIGYGGDAADVAVCNKFGPALYPTSQQVCARRIKDNHMSI